MRALFAKDPKLGREYAEATPDIAALPEHIKRAAQTRLRRRKAKR